MEPTLYQNLVALMRRQLGTFGLGFLLLLASNCLLILNPLVLRVAIGALDPQASRQGEWIESFFYFLLGGQVHRLEVWLLILLATAFVSAVFKYWMRLIFITASRDAEMGVRSQIFEKIQAQSMKFFDEYGIGELLSRMTNDISAYRDVLGPGIMYPLFFATLVIPGLSALFSISWVLGLISLVPILAIPIVNIAYRKQMFRLSLGVQEILGKMSGLVQEHYSAIRILKSYGMEAAALRQFTQFCREMFYKELRFSCVQGALFPFFTCLTRLTTVGLVLVSGWLVLKGQGVLTTADFVSFMWIQSYIFFPVLMLGWIIPVYERGKAAYGRLYEIYSAPIEVADRADSSAHIPPGAKIVFHHLSFTYPKGTSPALSSINLEIPAGTRLGITGPVGAGKTTLFRLLSREYEIGRGMITIAGRDIHEYSLKAIHNQIAAVEQGPFLFSKTVRDNVKFGRMSASSEEIELAAEYADLHETILGFPEQYDTLVGERGMTLSGGQKQRLALARAFLVNRSILLLDDVFSAVDNATERKIFEAIHRHLPGKTLLLITHRLSILEHMDRIIYMDRGQILEQGTHPELMALGGCYAAMVQLQGNRG